MNFQIVNYQGTPDEDAAITLLLTRVFVEEGYTDKSTASKMMASAELKKRGEILLARSPLGARLLKKKSGLFGKRGVIMKHIGESYEEVRKKLIGGDKKREARIELEASKLELLEHLVEYREKKV